MSDSLPGPKFRIAGALSRLVRVAARFSLPGLVLSAVLQVALMSTTLFATWAIYRGFFYDPLSRQTPTILIILAPMAVSATLGSFVAVMLAANAADCEQNGRAATFREAWSIPWRRGLPAVAVLLAQAMIVGLGTVLLVVPGIIAGLMVGLGLSACVTEGLAPLAALRRSMALSKGGRWRLLGYFIVSLLFVAACVAAATYGLGELTGAATDSDLANQSTPLAMALNFGLAALMLAYLSSAAYAVGLLPAVAFAELRAQEGAHELTEVFD